MEVMTDNDTKYIWQTQWRSC